MKYYAIESDSYLAHHGVKGMKWGVRKKYEYNENYLKEKRRYDERVRGRRAVKKISKYMDKGATLSKARRKYDNRKMFGRLTAGVLAMASFPIVMRAALDDDWLTSKIDKGKSFVNLNLRGIGYETFENGVKAQYYDPSKDIFRKISRLKPRRKKSSRKSVGLMVP